MYTGPSCSAMARVAARVACSSAGARTEKLGRAQASARSSIPICDGPSSPIETPAWLPMTFTGRPGKATDMRSWSKALHIMKQANEATKGSLPDSARPAAIPTRFDSAIPTL